MTEKGFYHTERGYWQTTGEPPEDIRASYPEGTKEVPLKPGPDYEWNDETESWDHVPPPEPTAVEVRASMPDITARQLRLVLFVHAGVSRSQVEAAIQDIEPLAKRVAAEIEWEYASSYKRTHPLVESIGASFGFTPEQVDDLWALGQTL